MKADQTCWHFYPDPLRSLPLSEVPPNKAFISYMEATVYVSYLLLRGTAKSCLSLYINQCPDCSRDLITIMKTKGKVPSCLEYL